VKPPIHKLARTLRTLPDNKPALYLVLQALRSTGELHAIAVLMECWISACQGARPEVSTLTLYWWRTFQRGLHHARALLHRESSRAGACYVAGRWRRV